MEQYGYDGLKRIISQCFDPAKASKGGQTYALNMAFKINMKLGGVNFSLWGMPRGLPRMSDILHKAAEAQQDSDLSTGAFMFIGIDVSHPERSAGNMDDDAFSVACITASMDPVRAALRARGSARCPRWCVITGPAKALHATIPLATLRPP